MATLSLTIVKAKVLKDGTHKIRIAVRHKHETCYIITRFIVKENQFRNGQVVRTPDAATVNARLRDMLDTYQERLDKINNKEIYTCRQLKSILQNAISSPADNSPSAGLSQNSNNKNTPVITAFRPRL